MAFLVGNVLPVQRAAFLGEGDAQFLQPVDLALAAVLLLAPLARHLVVERRVNDAVELIDVHGTNAVIKALVFGLMALDRLLVLAPLVGVAGVQRIAHPFQHLVVEVQPAQEFGELLLEHLLPNILAPAGRRVAFAFVGVTGAVVVDVAFLLDLADYRAAAGMAGCPASTILKGWRQLS